MELLKGAVRVLAGLAYQVPVQDLRHPLGRMPTRPRSGFVITDARPPDLPPNLSRRPDGSR